MVDNSREIRLLNWKIDELKRDLLMHSRDYDRDKISEIEEEIEGMREQVEQLEAENEL